MAVEIAIVADDAESAAALPQCLSSAPEFHFTTSYPSGSAALKIERIRLGESPLLRDMIGRFGKEVRVGTCPVGDEGIGVRRSKSMA